MAETVWARLRMLAPGPGGDAKPDRWMNPWQMVENISGPNDRSRGVAPLLFYRCCPLRRKGQGGRGSLARTMGASGAPAPAGKELAGMNRPGGPGGIPGRYAGED